MSTTYSGPSSGESRTMDKLESRQITSDHFLRCLQEIESANELEKASLRQETRRAIREAAAWRRTAYGTAAIFLAILTITALTVRARSRDTLAEPDATEPIQTVVVSEESQEDYENEKIEAALLARSHKIENCTVTYFCCEEYPHICGTGNGITATGTQVTPNISCAVDPAVIPLGTTVMVDYGDGDLQYYRAEDIGVTGGHVDLAVATHAEALKWGVQTATVYWCEEVT